jgi:hypothetical protein
MCFYFVLFCFVTFLLHLWHVFMFSFFEIAVLSCTCRCTMFSFPFGYMPKTGTRTYISCGCTHFYTVTLYNTYNLTRPDYHYLENLGTWWSYMFPLGTRGSVVSWCTVLQAGRSPVRVPDEVDFFNLPNLSSRTMALGSTQPLTEMSTRNLPGGKKRPARGAINLATICEPTVWKCTSLNLSQT